MDYSADIWNCIIQYLNDEKKKYQLDEESGVISFPMRIKGAVPHLNFSIRVYDDMYLLYIHLSLKCDEKALPEMRELINRINYSILYGCLELDADNEPRFRYCVDCTGRLPSQSVIKNSILYAASAIQKYGEALVRVSNGMCSGADAYKAAQG